MAEEEWKQSDPRARSACPCVVLCGPFPPFSVVRWVLPRREFSLHFSSRFLRQHFEWSAHVHAVHDGSLIIGGAISGSYQRPRCSRRPPPVARGVARVLCLGQTGHRDNPTESSEDARTPSSPDQNRLLPGCEPGNARERGPCGISRLDLALPPRAKGEPRALGHYATHNRGTRGIPGFGGDPAFRDLPGVVTKPGCSGPGENPGLHPKTD